MADDQSLPAAVQTIAQREASLLAPYAMHSVDSRGRKHAEPDHPYRGPFQRDRDRILHSAAFRRLSGKMQVFTGEMGDYHRTRLTHTHEVASIARTIGRALRLNEDLIEALALLHDIGHPPFGHAGEDALNECLTDEGGFSHNQHALTIVEELEIRFHEFPGLNLSHEVLDGQSTRIDKQNPGQKPLLEVQLVDAADSITYDAHDTDDAVKLGLVTLDELADNTLVRDSIRHVRNTFASLDDEMLRKAVVHQLIERQVSDVLNHCGSQLGRLDLQSADNARQSEVIIGPSRELSDQKSELESYLYNHVYRHPQLIQVRSDAQKRIHSMFDGYAQRPELLPPRHQTRAARIGLRRAIGEYLAGMTDRFCDEQYRDKFS